jgi:hypothetical protein
MKMTYLLLAFLVGAVLLALGCAAISSTLGPREGRYTYTHKVPRLEPPIRLIPIWIDKNFGEFDQIALDDAVNAWNYALNGFIVLKIVDTHFDMEVPKIVEQVKANGWLFLKIDSNNSLVPVLTNSYRAIGFCEQVGGHHLYLVRDRMFNQDVFGVTMHEIGHLLGARHLGDRLMFPHFSRARFQCVDLTTLRQVARYNQLPADQLNFCVDADGLMKDEGRVGICPN